MIAPGLPLPRRPRVLSESEVKAAKKVLRKLFPGLSKLQLNAIVSEAPVNDDRLVMWAKFVPIAAPMVAACDPPLEICHGADEFDQDEDVSRLACRVGR